MGPSRPRSVIRHAPRLKVPALQLRKRNRSERIQRRLSTLWINVTTNRDDVVTAWLPRVHAAMAHTRGGRVDVPDWIQNLAGRADGRAGTVLHLFGGPYLTVDGTRMEIP